MLLVGSVLLLSMVTTAAISAVGARRGTSSEHASYTALLGAESGINTFPALAEAHPPASAVLAPDATFTSDRDRRAAIESNLNDWLGDEGLASRDLGNGVTVSLEIDVLDSSTTTVVSTARYGRAESQVARDFSVASIMGDLNLKAPAPLVSKPSITMNGNAYLRGVDASLASWTYAAGTTHEGGTIGAGDIVDLAVSTATLDQVQQGEYLEIPIPGHAAPARLVVTSLDRMAGTVRVEALRPTTPVTFASDAPITHVPYAPRQSVSADPGTFPVTRVTSYAEQDVVVVTNEASTSVEGTVTGVDEEAGTITVDWNHDPGVVAEGSAIRKFIVGAVSDGFVDEGNTGKDTVWPDGQEFARLPGTQGVNALFQSILGATPTEVQAMAAAVGTSYGSWDEVPDLENLAGITYIRSGTDTNVQYCGSGVLIVAGNLKTNNAPCSFTGVIYVRGEWFEKGNRELIGSVITQGEAEVCLDDGLGATCRESTDLRGTGDKITYDPDEVYKAGQGVLASGVTFTSIDSTWRQGYE